ncbi:MAG: hypothetical protein SGBAC_008460 [Bacillariaceae sp.]
MGIASMDEDGDLANVPPQQVSSPRALECDYDKNPTNLYTAIERKDWEHAIDIIHSDEAEEQAGTWVLRKELNGKLRWRLLPLHAAVMFRCPMKLVELLLADFPLGAQSKDDQGMLPLHLAFRNESSWETIEELMTAFPQAIFVCDRKGRTPLDCGSRIHVSGNASQASSQYPENRAFKAVCSVLDLYAQIMESEVRKSAQEESRSMVEATIGQLQDTQYDKVKNLKKEFKDSQDESQGQIKKLEEENKKLKDSIQSQDLDLSVARTTEKQLTDKLREMTIALKQSNETIKAKYHDRKMDDTSIVLKNMMEKLLIQQKQYERQFENLMTNYETLLEERRKIQSIFIEASEQQIVHEKEVLNDAQKFLHDQQKKLNQDILGILGDEKKTDDP